MDNVNINLATSQALTTSILQPKASTFALFTKLPIELQRMIWKASLPSARVITLEKMNWTYDKAEGKWFYKIILASSAFLPLQTACSESRELVLKEMKQDRSFTIFPQLPPEIRRKIWKAALPGPRLISVGDLKCCPTVMFFGKTAFLLLLTVCSESRTVAKEKGTKRDVY